MQSKPKSNSVVTHALNDDGTITFDVLTVGTFTFDVRTVCGAEAYDALTETGRRGVINGFVQRISDRAAKSRDTKTGKSATPQEKFDAMKELADHYANGGEWALRGIGVWSAGGELAAAIIRLYPERDATMIREGVKHMAKSGRDALSNRPDIKDTLDAIRAKRIAASLVNGDMILGELLR